MLGEGRRIATHLGATLYGIVISDDTDTQAIEQVGLGGADKIIPLSVPNATTPKRHDLAPSLFHFTEILKPNLILCPDSADAKELAPRLAAQMGALFLSDVSVEHAPDEVLLHEWNWDRTKRRTVTTSEFTIPVVATVSTANMETAHGEDDAEVISIDSPTVEGYDISLREQPASAQHLEEAEIVVTAGLGAAEFLDQVDRLAEALGACRASTQSLWQAGLADKASVVDLSIRRIAPRLNLICGAAGSPSHLGAIGAGCTIVALGRDPLSPLFRAATYGLLGELAETLPACTSEASRLRGDA